MELICVPGRIESSRRDLTAADWLRIGSRAGHGREQVGIGAAYGCPEESRLAVMAGILSAGADVWDFGELTLPEFRCCVRCCSPSLALLLLPPRSARVLSPEGEALFPLKRQSSRCRREGRRIDMQNLQKLYPVHLLKAGLRGMDGVSACFSGPDTHLTGLLEQVFCQLGGRPGGELTLRLGGDGDRVLLSRGGRILWEGEATDGDGPAQGLRLLSELAKEEALPAREEKRDSAETAFLSETAVHTPFT